MVESIETLAIDTEVHFTFAAKKTRFDSVNVSNALPRALNVRLEWGVVLFVQSHEYDFFWRFGNLYNLEIRHFELRLIICSKELLYKMIVF